MLRTWQADLHVHTCLSPCAGLEMTPRKIVAAARERRLDVVAITDHNSAENTAAVQVAAAGSGLVVLAGMELTTAEEVHLVALLGEAERAAALQELVYGALPPESNDEEAFGVQVVASAEDEVDGICQRLLIGATELPLENAIEAIHGLGGIAIAAHIDRESYSVLSQLGFLPEGVGLDALELSGGLPFTEARQRWPSCGRWPLLHASDAHDLESLGRHPVWLRAAHPGLEEWRLALAGAGGRTILEREP